MVKPVVVREERKENVADRRVLRVLKWRGILLGIGLVQQVDKGGVVEEGGNR